MTHIIQHTTIIIFMIFVVIKSICELYKNAVSSNKDQPVYGSFIHSNQHMVFLIAIIIFQLINIFTYIMFIAHYDYRPQEDFLLWFKIAFLNIIFLLFINHFKQERLNKTETINFIDIFKF